MTSARRYPRTARVNESMLEVLADELSRMNDPRLELVTFTGVKVSRDLSHATVFYSTLAATTARCAGDVRGQRRRTPLTPPHPISAACSDASCESGRCRASCFKVDPGIVSGQRIEEILREIHHDEGAEEQAGSNGIAEENG